MNVHGYNPKLYKACFITKRTQIESESDNDTKERYSLYLILLYKMCPIIPQQKDSRRK